MRDHDNGLYEDEEFVREGGVLVPKSGGREVGPGDNDGPPAEWVEDPGSEDDLPGTRDDLPYDYGVEVPRPADETIDGPDNVYAGFGSMGETGAPKEGDGAPLGQVDERDLWRRQRQLIQESDAEEQHMRGLEDQDTEAIHDAEAEDAEETVASGPDGTSATGSG